MKPKFLTKLGTYRIGNLFIETVSRDRVKTATPGVDLPEFTLMPEDTTNVHGNIFRSMGKLFVEAGDVTGYRFAIDVLGSYDHFLQLCDHKVIGPHIDRWKEILKTKIDSEALAEVDRIAKKGGTQVELSAAKYLANREYEAKDDVGRPKKKQHNRKEAAKAREESIQLKEEMERLGLTH